MRFKMFNDDLYVLMWQMGVLEEKLLKELPEDARVIVCSFPFPHWPHSCTAGSGLNQVWAYDVHTAREPSRRSTHQSQA